MEERTMVMWLIVSFLAALCLFALAAIWIRHMRERREMERHFVTAEELHALLSSGREMLIFDLREPLDILTDSEIIPGAKIISPQKVFLNPFLIPHEKDSVIYCTCPSEATSRAVLKRALAMRFSRIKLLQGGLEGWKAKGYPVEPYTKPLHLDAGE
ncbi:MAG: rhodanese-like domain-containing protein [Acidobacteriaceae bacterium]